MEGNVLEVLAKALAEYGTIGLIAAALLWWILRELSHKLDAITDKLERIEKLLERPFDQIAK